MIAETKDFRSYAVRISIEAIWNIIEVGGTDAIVTMATSPEIVIALRRTFERVIKEGYKLDDKCLRNELTILINYIVTIPESHRYFFDKDTNDENGTSFFDSILHFATHDELNSTVKFVGENTPNKPLFTTRDEDVEFKKLL